MKIYSIIAEKFKLDGGACFGTVPKTIWQKHLKVDENNLIEVVTRCLLVEDDNRLILFDTGMGNKQDEKYFSHFHLFGDESLEKGIQELGFKLSDITDVVFTHLHFDHCGGAFRYNADKSQIVPLFENAEYWCSEAHWYSALYPNPREKASYFAENILPIEQSGKLNLVKYNTFLTENIELRMFHGHTIGQMIPFVHYHNKTLVFMADFIPSFLHIPIGYLAGFDTQPLVSMDEKKHFLKEAYEGNYTLLFEHDIDVECCDLQTSEKGIRLNNTFNLQSFVK
ncbi:MAG: MBL fold metallo-hydrolase [Bacteroidota bacterium]